MPPPPTSKFDLKRKIGPLPLWGWIVVVVGVYYIYRRYYTTDQAPAEAAVGFDGYETYSGGYSGADFGGGGQGGGTNGYLSPVEPTTETTEPPPAEEGGGIDGGAGNPNRDRRHRIQRIKRKTGRRIETIKRGGVTPTERRKIQAIKQRRKTRIRKLRGR
jgi:hypothetical protein